MHHVIAYPSSLPILSLCVHRAVECTNAIFFFLPIFVVLLFARFLCRRLVPHCMRSLTVVVIIVGTRSSFIDHTDIMWEILYIVEKIVNKVKNSEDVLKKMMAWCVLSYPLSLSLSLLHKISILFFFFIPHFCLSHNRTHQNHEPAVHRGDHVQDSRVHHTL